MINGKHGFIHRGTAADEGVVQQIFAQQDYSLRRLRRAGELVEKYNEISLRAKPLIVDCGANIGASAMYFALEYPRATIIAVEPESANFTLLEKNAEGFSIECVRAAIAD